MNITDAVMHKFLQMWFIADFLDFLMVILCIDKSNSPNHNHSTHEFQNLFLNDFLHKSLMLPPVCSINVGVFNVLCALLGSLSYILTRAVASGGLGGPPLSFLAKQFSNREADYAHHSTTSPSGF